MYYQFRKATEADAPEVWEILQQAIRRRKADGSEQWQDGYPNPEVLRSDIEEGRGYVLAENDRVIGYCAVILNDEPVYAEIDGKWLSDGDFLVVHRVAIAETHIRKGFATKILTETENLAREMNVRSIKADTNFDNPAMLRVFEQLNYTYCGKVYFRESERKAYEKVVDWVGI